MCKSNVIQQILSCPENYPKIIQQANYNDIQTVFSTYIQHYTGEEPREIMGHYTEQELREKLLGSSQTVIRTLRKDVEGL